VTRVQHSGPLAGTALMRQVQHGGLALQQGAPVTGAFASRTKRIGVQ